MCFCRVCLWGSQIKVFQILIKINIQSFDYFFLSMGIVFLSQKEISLVWQDLFLINLFWLLVISYLPYTQFIWLLIISFFLELKYLYILVFSWVVFWNYIILIEAVECIWVIIFLRETTAGSAIQPWQILAFLPSAPQQRHCNCTSGLISHQHMPVVLKGSVLHRKDTSETLFCSGRERSRFWRGALFQVYFFYSLGMCGRGGRTGTFR